jgi:hypothetical protein
VIENGDYYVRINATDNTGNVKIVGPNIITGDVSQPSITITSILPDPSNGDVVIIATNITEVIDENGLRANVTTPSGVEFFDLNFQSGSTWTYTYTVSENGIYSFGVNGTDIAGNTGYAPTVNIVGDVSAPWINLVSVTPNLSNGVTVITATNASADINGAIKANITTPSGFIFLDLNYQGGNSWTNTFTVTEDGNYTVNINATDYASNTNSSGPIVIVGDVTAPGIILVSVTPDPSNSTTTITATNSSVDINGDGIRANITTPSGFIFIDLNYQGGNSWTNTFSVTEDGTYTVILNATDDAGNINYSNSISIIGDVTLPFVDITTPANDGNQLGGATVAISGMAYGTGSNIASTYINDTRWSITVTPVGNPNGLFTFTNTSFIDPGFYWIEINITDDAGNFNTSQRFFEVISADLNPPILIITSLSPNPSNGFVEIIVISNEPIIGKPLLNIRAPNSTVFYRPMILSGSLTWTGNFSFADDGIYEVGINGTDIASNVGFVNRSFVGDFIAPGITIINIAPDPSNGNTVITATNSSIDIDGVIQVNITSPSGFIFIDLIYQGGNIWNNTFTVMEDGTYTVRINATDYAGNVNISAPMSIEGDVTPPTIIITSILPDPSNGAVVITATNTTEVIGGNGLRANVTTPSGVEFFDLNFQSGSTWTYTYTVSENGIYTFGVNGTDLAGNTGYAITVDIEGDVTPPTIIIISVLPDPSNGAVVITATNTTEIIDVNGLRGNVTMLSGVEYFDFNFQGGNIWNYTYTVTETGTYTFGVNGTDIAGNTGYATTVDIEGDVSAPWIILANVSPDPSNGVTVITATNASADINSNGIRANITTPSGFIFIDLIYQGGNLWNNTFTVSLDGVYSIRLNATDFTGNTNTTRSISIVGDGAAPLITIDNVTPNPSNGLTVITALNSSSDINSNGIWANITTPSGRLFVKLNYQGSDTWIGNFTVIEDGPYYIRINATDNADNTNTTNLYIIHGDFTPPNITIDSPSNEIGATAPDFSISITETFLNTTWYSLFDGTAWSDNITFTGLTGSIDQDLWRAIPQGTIIVRFYANDTLGQIGYQDVEITKKIAISIGPDNSSQIIMIGIIAVASALFLIILRGATHERRFLQRKVRN